jgi:hypothetical protein
MRISLAIVDQVRPAVAAWLQGMSPTAVAALRGATRLITHAAVRHAQAQLRRRTGKRAPLAVRSLGTQIQSRLGGHPFALIWWRRGILAAHEIGATVPPAALRPRNRKVLAWGGPPGGPHTHFSRGHRRGGFTLRKRPMLEPAYREQEAAVLALFDAEYQKVFAAGSTATAIRERVGG